MAIHIEHLGFVVLGSILNNGAAATVLGFENLDLSETSAIKVEKIDFPKTKLARLALKLFLHSINSAKAPRRQKANNGSGSKESRFVRNIKHARSQHAFLHLPKCTSFRHGKKLGRLRPKKQSLVGYHVGAHQVDCHSG